MHKNFTNFTIPFQNIHFASGQKLCKWAKTLQVDNSSSKNELKKEFVIYSTDLYPTPQSYKASISLTQLTYDHKPFCMVPHHWAW